MWYAVVMLLAHLSLKVVLQVTSTTPAEQPLGPVRKYTLPNAIAYAFSAQQNTFLF